MDTGLRGASTLQLRTAASSHVSEEQMILVRGTQLSSCSITGKLQAREVKIYLKHNMITLRLVKKLLRGAISTYKEYRITGTAEERRDVGIDDGHGFSSIALVTTEGTVQLLFEDLKQYLQWSSTIYHLLCIRDETNLII
ncbi:hypothetical protein AXF42_Ash002038 [Apostasia shenzhenica]|uniref:Pleckstrin-like plant domain-containing protein n=1 Tax=Apostasia shenzhenica TaxID=1088818 RepID=A0A2I0AC22_9ASPA|nr:hypothetical protein AXF42_Ash002038 [Apostasia shenzhenica]